MIPEIRGEGDPTPIRNFPDSELPLSYVPFSADLKFFKNSLPLLSIFSPTDDYRMNGSCVTLRAGRERSHKQDHHRKKENLCRSIWFAITSPTTSILPP